MSYINNGTVLTTNTALDNIFLKSGKAVVPDDIPVEVWKCLGEVAVDFLIWLFNRILETEKMPESGGKVFWYQSTRTVMCRGLELMSHTMKI